MASANQFSGNVPVADLSGNPNKASNWLDSGTLLPGGSLKKGIREVIVANWFEPLRHLKAGYTRALAGLTDGN